MIQSSNVTWCFDSSWKCQSRLVLVGDGFIVGVLVDFLLQTSVGLVFCTVGTVDLILGTHFWVNDLECIGGILWFGCGCSFGFSVLGVVLWSYFGIHIWRCPCCASNNFFGTYLWVEDTCGKVEVWAVWVLCGVVCCCFGFHTSFCLVEVGVEDDVEVVSYVGGCLTDDGKTTSLPLWGTSLVYFVESIQALGEMNGWRM